MIYQWKTKYFKSDPQQAGELCEELSKTIGLTPKNLVDASREEDAPLHKDFEWDNSKAAEAFREHQARILIRNLITVDVVSEQSEPVRAFYNIENSNVNAGIYESAVSIMSSDEKRAILLRNAKEELNRFKRKYSALKELSDVFKAIDAL